jgi:hypothetical protein
LAFFRFKLFCIKFIYLRVKILLILLSSITINHILNFLRNTYLKVFALIKAIFVFLFFIKVFTEIKILIADYCLFLCIFFHSFFLKVIFYQIIRNLFIRIDWFLSFLLVNSQRIISGKLILKFQCIILIV